MEASRVFSVFKKKKTSCRKRASRTDGSSLLHRRETKLERDSVRLILSMPTTMQRDRPHKRAPPMRAADEKQRNTEPAAARKCLNKAPATIQKALPALRFVKIKHSLDGWQAAATTIQQGWRDLAGMA